MKAPNRTTDVIALKKVMVEKGFKTINALASAAGINRTTLGKVLDGRIQPSSDVMFKLVETLEISAPDAGNIFFARNLRGA